jgi:hypothetical protein
LDRWIQMSFPSPSTKLSSSELLSSSHHNGGALESVLATGLCKATSVLGLVRKSHVLSCTLSGNQWKICLNLSRRGTRRSRNRFIILQLPPVSGVGGRPAEAGFTRKPTANNHRHQGRISCSALELQRQSSFYQPSSLVGGWGWNDDGVSKLRDINSAGPPSSR